MQRYLNKPEAGSLDEPWRTPSMEGLLNVKQVAELLNVKRSYVYGLTSTGRIPFIKIGNHLRFRRADINGWLDMQLRSTSDVTRPEGEDPV